jgi:hypothetical protein
MRFSILLASLSLALVACTTSADPSGPEARGPEDDEAPTSCVRACQVAFEACGDTPEDRDLVRDCAESCPFTAREALCLSRQECGDDVSACD